MKKSIENFFLNRLRHTEVIPRSRLNRFKNSCLDGNANRSDATAKISALIDIIMLKK